MGRMRRVCSRDTLCRSGRLCSRAGQRRAQEGLCRSRRGVWHSEIVSAEKVSWAQDAAGRVSAVAAVNAGALPQERYWGGGVYQ